MDILYLVSAKETSHCIYIFGINANVNTIYGYLASWLIMKKASSSLTSEPLNSRMTNEHNILSRHSK